MSLCPTCKSSFVGGEQFCPRDGTPLRPSLPDDPLSGRVLSGRYRLMELIGRGGMGAVYRAHHILMDKPVAVKVLRAELASDTEAVARFHREARSASRLDHESIIRVTDFGQTDDGLLFLVMELLDGENLAQVIKRGALTWRRSATIARDIAMGLGHAHEQGVIHRDLKPENVVILRKGKGRQLVKVLDFGLAKLMHEAGPTGSASDDGPDRSLTRTGVVFGTPEYMSPEQAEGRTLGPHTDLYALGVVMYQMVTGSLPFSAPTFIALIAKTVHEPPPRPSLHVPGGKLPGSLEDLILRCLAKTPEDRPASAEEIADELDAMLAQNLDDVLEESSSPAVSVAKNPSLQPSSPSKPTLQPGEAAPGGIAKTVQRVAVPKSGGTKASTPTSPAVASAFEALGKREKPVSGPPKPLPVPAGPTDASVPGDGSASSPDSVADKEPPAVVAQVEASAEPSQTEVPALKLPATKLPAINEESSVSHNDPVKVPQRPYWLIGVLGLAALLGTGAYVGPKLLRKSPSSTLIESDDLRQARRLLASDQSAAGIEAAIRKLLAVRQTQENAELHRLLSSAYEAQHNRLRALGHMYLAVQRSTTMAERSQSQLSLAQLLSRLGHIQESCQTAQRLLREHPVPTGEIQVNAQALLLTLKCDGK
ncbi:MAG: protein kinase [Myxococcales bacterium]|nr:protein kinase [Myxococcales bacterium]